MVAMPSASVSVFVVVGTTATTCRRRSLYPSMCACLHTGTMDGNGDQDVHLYMSRWYVLARDIGDYEDTHDTQV